MQYLLLGFLVFVLIGWMSRNSLLKLPTWRLGAGMASIAVFAAAGYAGLRNGWPVALVLGVIGVWLAVSARSPRGPTVGEPRAGRIDDTGLSVKQARSILGVGPDATAEEIQAAYKRLMLRVHPDNGGAEGLAAQLNAARDRLLKP